MKIKNVKKKVQSISYADAVVDISESGMWRRFRIGNKQYFWWNSYEEIEDIQHEPKEDKEESLPPRYLK